MPKTFTASIKEWTKKTRKAQDAIFRNSVQALADEMTLPRSKGGKMRVDTGFLRNSLVASTQAMPRIDGSAQPEPGSFYAGGDAAIALVVAGTKFGDDVYLGFTANYALPREYGANGQPPDAFVRSAAQNWQNIVNREARKIN